MSLQDNSKLDRAKIIAGVITLFFLAGYFWDTLRRGPNSLYTVVVGVFLFGLAVALVVSLSRRARDRRWRQ